jgi:quercetin dioxygenase-like cupin family protein
VAETESQLPERIRQLPRGGGDVPRYTLSAPGCDVLFVVGPTGASVPRHVHDTDNVTVVISGETVITTDAGEQRHGPGEWYETRKNEQHSIRFDVDTVQIELRFAVG